MNIRNMLREMGTIRQLLSTAEAEARRMGDEQPGAEHLLLAAMDLPDGSARELMERHGVDRERLRTALAAGDMEALAAVGIDPELAAELAPPRPLPPAAGVYRSSASAQEAFQAVAAMARAAKPSHLIGAHVVKAEADMELGTAPRLLASLGVQRRALLQDAERAIAEASLR